jgi:hypothetical protein
MSGGGTRLGEEVRDDPHRDNRGGGNRGGVAHTAASLRPQARPGLSGSGLYNAPGRAFLNTLLCTALRFGAIEALRRTLGSATMTIPGGVGTPPRVQVQFLCARCTGFYHGVGASTIPTVRGSGLLLLAWGGAGAPLCSPLE